MLNSTAGLLLLLLSYLEGEKLILVSAYCLPSDSSVMPSAAEGQIGRRPPARPCGAQVSWV